MNSKNLYDEGEINENEEEDEEIIDNEDEEFDDSIHKPIKSNELQNINEKEIEKNNQIKNDLNINHPLFNIQLKKVVNLSCNIIIMRNITKYSFGIVKIYFEFAFQLMCSFPREVIRKTAQKFIPDSDKEKEKKNKMK